VSFDLGDYVDVAERVRQFNEKYPDGSLQGEGEFIRDEAEAVIGYLYRAYAYRDRDDNRPGIGHAYEPIPGRTTFTKDSEVQNAETSAWGRAIVALGFETKKIASANEVRNRQNGDLSEAGSVGDPSRDTSAGDRLPSAGHAPQPASESSQPADGGNPMNVEITFGKHKGKTVKQLPEDYKKWLVENFEPKTAEQRRIIAAVQDDLNVPF
jgi:hypothetical protein